MTRTAIPLKVDRFKKILSIVNARKRLSLAELERELQAPRITVQRDLVDLENRKLVRRFHGGVMSIGFSGDFYNYDLKKAVHVEAKKKIASKAIKLVRENSAVCLDASSTVYYLSETLFPAKVLALTCSIDAFNNLSAREDVQAVLAGGRLNRKTATLCGPEMIETIKRFHFDIAFISAEAFVPDRGFFDPHEEEVAVKRALIDSSEKVVMMLDRSKVAPASGILVCGNDEIDYVITETTGNPALKKIFKNRLL